MSVTALRAARIRRPAAVLLAAAAVACLGRVAPAAAAPPDLPQLVARLAPAPAAGSAAGGVEVTAGAVGAEVSDTAGHTLTLTRIGAAGAPAAAGGLTTFAGADTAVQETPRGARLLAVLRDASESSVRWRMSLPAGARAAVDPAGRVAVTGAGGRLLFGLPAPWAKDARGRALPTSFAVEGDVLTQRVDLTGATFPVVADPEVRIGLNAFFITLSPDEQKLLLQGGVAAGAALGAASCIQLGYAAAVCAVGGLVLAGILIVAIQGNVSVKCPVEVELDWAGNLRNIRYPNCPNPF